MKKTLIIMAALFCGVSCAEKALYPTDVITTADGGELRITFFSHASLAFEYEGKHIYVDPVSDFADYASLPKADVVFITHEHGDHLDLKALKELSTPKMLTIGSGTVVEALRHDEVFAYSGGGNGNYEVLEHDEIKTLPFMTAEAVPAYNILPDKLQFHPWEAQHNGYIFTFGGTRVYVAGDTEDVPEVMILTDIDIAFLPVNLPYTMTEEQAARVVNTIKPKIFYPYHYGKVQHTTDLAQLAELIEGSGVEMRVRPLE